MDRLIDLTSAITRRGFAIGAALAGTSMLLPRTGATAARQAEDFGSLDLPTLDIIVLHDGYDGLPDSIAAGRYLINITCDAGVEGDEGIAFTRPPAGMTAEAFLTALAPPTMASPAASPVADAGPGGASPAAMYQATWAGGTSALPGESSSVVLDLTEGEWIAWGDDPESTQVPTILSVTGTFPADAPEPAADITATFIDFEITIDGNLVAGDHLLKVENTGAQPHLLYLDRYIGSGTLDDESLATALEAAMSGADMPEGLNPETDLESAGVALTQSIGTMSWIPVSLQAGTHSAICFFPAAGTGLPHAFMGMHTVFEVTE
ncbi:MAG: hypothetical protein H0W06_07345 [Chloroflexia bacterium]|nr:hypothetical protein [Chloroflexia bacterium]